MISIIVLLFVLLIFLIPIPIKITIHFSNDDYYLKVYRIDIYSKSNGLLKKILNKKRKKGSKNISTANKENITSKKTNRKKDIPSSKKVSLKKLYSNLNRNKYKPSIIFEAEMNYSFNDSFINTISYGLLCNLTTILGGLFSIFFKLNRINLNINPHINSPSLLNITIYSIIRFNLVQIIYILFLIINSKPNLKEVNPL